MADYATRFPRNPILTPAHIIPSRESFIVESVLNPGAFTYRGRVGLLLRVAERPRHKEGFLLVPVLNPEAVSGIDIVEIDRSDPELDLMDPRIFTYRGKTYLTTVSHLRLAWSDDGENFDVDPAPSVMGAGPLESFGIEDCRVTQINDEYVLTYTAASACGVGIGMMTTRDWTLYTRQGMVIPPDNKDCAVFDREIKGHYYALHRPSNHHIVGHHIWLASSPDLRHWGNHHCIAMTRPGMWDEGRIGAGAAPIHTPEGWLAIYHGATTTKRYCLGALLLDLDDPRKVIARSKEPIMEPREEYEKRGFFDNVVFTNGHIVKGDRITMYYGASDSVVCGAYMSIMDILGSLGR